MLHTPESQHMTDHLAGEMGDLQTIARLHALPIGSPERLQALPLRLAKDVRLRSDLTELVRSLQARDPDLGLPDVLSLLLRTIGGSSSLEGRRDMEEVVDLTGGFLASLGGWPGSAVEPLTDIDNPPDHDPRLDLAASTYTEGLEADLAPAASSLPEASGPAPEIGETTAPTPDGSVTLAQITHALARLERGNLELRLHLDSIDQRICRMEPLLEAAPLGSPVDDVPPRPEPAPASRASVPAPESGELVHRGSTISEYELKRQREEEIKAQRRISLSSSFADPVPEALQTSSVGNAPPQRGTAVALASAPPASLDESARQAPPSQPRRDRFAAAREIPGNAADSDPLYTATDEELAAAPRNSSRPSAGALSPAASVVRESASPSTPAAKIPVPDEVYREPAPPARLKQPERLEYLKLDPIDTPAVPASPRPSTRLPAEPVRKHTGVWIGSLAAAAVLGSAGYLYTNGLPSLITEWVSGSRTTSSSTAGQSEPKTTDAVPAQNTSATTGVPTASSSIGMEWRDVTSGGHLPGAHDSSSSSASIEKISGPTFVPGGVMDGYLISAPRPQYPELANLAGVQGKISFEAMISETGSVEALKVLGGPQLLRGAATDAVRQWQYRPFQVKGRPVEVRTIIRVDVAAKASVAADQ